MEVVQENVNNDNSQQYCGIANPRQHHRQQSVPQRQPNAASYFPQPSFHPALAMHMQSQEQLPIGNSTETRDSFNTTNNTKQNVGNDSSSSLRYEGPDRQGRSRRRKEPYPSSMPAHFNGHTQLNQMAQGSVNVAPGDVSAMPQVMQMALQPPAATAAQDVDEVPTVAIDVEKEDGELDELDDSGSSFE
ncbi:hypothetical protein D9613_000008 [Agrocybe pediades]|uniref:Uncharacterized protein n=1 Tax=Agrocybe pediades TaxID=84607 RepID=A0A8H4VSA5_9AGAR|nr:hypothetical protein D9613_000008 [Agrocybe pediades]